MTPQQVTTRDRVTSADVRRAASIASAPRRFDVRLLDRAKSTARPAY
jgi:hypothetical protein